MGAEELWNLITYNQDTPFDLLSLTTGISEDRLRLFAILWAMNDRERFTELVKTLPKKQTIADGRDTTRCIWD